MIRLGVPADLAAVARVYRSASLSNARDRDQLLDHPEYLVMGPKGLTEGRTYVAEENGSVVGFATWAETDSAAATKAAAETKGAAATDGAAETKGAAETEGAAETKGAAELEGLFVDPPWMRRGIATALVNRVADVLRVQGAGCLELTANPDALAFYRAAGFTNCGVTTTVAGSAPRMRLTLR
jgi:GNAT superfamily N-acetyltransferase